MQVVLVVHGQKQKNGHGCKKGLWHKREKNIFFFVNWWNAAEVWPLVEDRCSSDKNVMIRPAKWIRLCFHNSATKKEGKRKPSFPKTFEAVFEIIVLGKKYSEQQQRKKDVRTHEERTKNLRIVVVEVVVECSAHGLTKVKVESVE